MPPPLIPIVTFDENSAGATGGAVDFKSVAGSVATFQNVTFTNNVASAYN
jgi:predicted outer membrane repeat protein